MAKLPKRINTSQKNLEKLRRAASDKRRAVEIEIEKIKPPKFHDRRYIDRHSIYELSESIKATGGLISPIVVRELEDGTIERIIGYRRIEAYKILKKERIPAIVLQNVSDEQAVLLMTTENMQRENLSPYDETLALLDYISVALNKTRESTIKILRRFKNYNAGNVKLSEDERELYEEIDEILKKTGRITVSSLVNRFPMLDLHPVLKEALSKGAISFSNARLLDSIEDESVLKKAVEHVIKNNLSKRETAEYVKKLTKRSDTGKSEYARVLKKVAKLDFDNLEDGKREKIETIMKNLEKIIAEIEKEKKKR